MTVQINPERLITNLRRLAEFGKYKTGVDRIAFSKEDGEARFWLRDQLDAIGLEAKVDGIGNVYGRWPGVQKAVLVGSHTDTVPRGGWLDGALGVVYGLEIACSFREHKSEIPIGIDVISFQDEEGTYLPLLGSKSFCGLLDDDVVKQCIAADGTPLQSIIEQSTFSGELIRAEKHRHSAYLEAHIEQGPRLVSNGATVGVVSGIVGIRRLIITSEGRADHAGTTPMEIRQDASVALLRLANWVWERFPKLSGGETVWNIGRISLLPGAANVVPARAELVLEFRDLDDALLDRMEAAVWERVEALSKELGRDVRCQRTASIPPSPMSSALRQAMMRAAEAESVRAITLPSGAGHDAMALASIVPSAMLFVPSINGRSHDIEEDTDEADIILGCRVLARTIDGLING